MLYYIHSLRNLSKFIVVSHAPCDIAMALHLEGKSLQESSLEAWPLGGLTLFSRVIHNADDDETMFGEWNMEFYGKSDHMPVEGGYNTGLKRWTLPSLTK